MTNSSPKNFIRFVISRPEQDLKGIAYIARVPIKYVLGLMFFGTWLLKLPKSSSAFMHTLLCTFLKKTKKLLQNLGRKRDVKHQSLIKEKGKKNFLNDLEVSV